MSASEVRADRLSRLAARLRHRLAVTAIRRGAWPLPPRSTDRLRDLAILAMGLGSASLKVEESGERDLLDQLASLWSEREEVTVLDVGCHSGDYTRAARSAFGTKAWIHSFEPNPALFAALRLELEADVRIACHELALGDKVGSAPLFLDKAGSSRGSLVERSFDVTKRPIEDTHDVAVTTVDQLAEDLGLARIDLLKLDVEGHELAVLRGAEQMLASDRIEVVQFEFGERNLASRTYLGDFFELLGPRFSFFRITPRGLVPTEYRPKCELFVGETNYVAIAGESGRLS